MRPLKRTGGIFRRNGDGKLGCCCLSCKSLQSSSLRVVASGIQICPCPPPGGVNTNHWLSLFGGGSWDLEWDDAMKFWIKQNCAIGYWAAFDPDSNCSAIWVSPDHPEAPSVFQVDFSAWAVCQGISPEGVPLIEVAISGNYAFAGGAPYLPYGGYGPGAPLFTADGFPVFKMDAAQPMNETHDNWLNCGTGASAGLGQVLVTLPEEEEE